MNRCNSEWSAVSSADVADATDETAAADDTAELAAQVEVLSEENRRLRDEYRRAQQTRHRRTALGFAGIGLVALVGAFLFVGSRTVLLALSGTGLFAAVLVYMLTPERFIAASVGERVYDAYATTGRGLVADLGLTDERVYVPVGDDARLFIPQQSTYTIPEPEALDQTFIVSDDDRRRGVALEPTGNGLYHEFERDLTDAPADDPATLGTQLADALVDGFELVNEARPEAEPGRLSLAISGHAYGDIDEFDHPVPSFLAVSVATAVEQPVTITISRETDERADVVVTCQWNPSGTE